MKLKRTLISLGIAAGLAMSSTSAIAASEADVALGVIGGIILGGILTTPRPVYAPPPPVYYPPPVVYYPPPPPVYYPPPCYNRPVPVYDPWGRQIGWRDIRVCQ